MTADVLLQQVLEKTGLPVRQYEYKGAKPEYILINEEDERGIGHADDRPQAMSLWWQVHIFAPAETDFRSRKRQVISMLLEAGITLGNINVLYEQETETMHVVISCNITENITENMEE